MNSRSYPAVKVRQTADGANLILFAAPATDVEDWAGIPQRERLGTDSASPTGTAAETVGFQREESEKRLRELEAFFGNPKNIIQNPLLCAARSADQFTFEATGGAGDDRVAHGMLTIEWEDLRALTLLDLLRRVQTALEARLPELAQTPLEDAKITRLKQRANAEHPALAVSPEEESDEPVLLTSESEDEPADDDPVSVLFTDDTHIADFWMEVAARVKVLEEYGVAYTAEEFLGFTREAMIGYLQPVVVVDGQHRLRGALAAARAAVDRAENHDEVVQAVGEGADPDQVTETIRRREARALPISLLMETSPAEHVFQFVVVNQKATPIHKALLGTIVSTSLTADELGAVSERLKLAGIPIQDSQAIAYLTRHPDSPFKDLVEKGLSSESSSELLPWNVLGSLVNIFRHLKGGKLFHAVRNDYADRWRRVHLDKSALVAEGVDTKAKAELWARADGPWREVFVAFWQAVRDRLAVTDDPEAGNFWGRPRSSNLFNKVSLTILAADFFQFLCERGLTIDDASDVPTYVEEWLTGVKTTYFSRDWKLAGVKKDAPGTRAQWASLWVDYRKDPVALPQLPNFRQQRAV